MFGFFQGESHKEIGQFLIAFFRSSPRRNIGLWGDLLGLSESCYISMTVHDDDDGIKRKHEWVRASETGKQDGEKCGESGIVCVCERAQTEPEFASFTTSSSPSSRFAQLLKSQYVLAPRSSPYQSACDNTSAAAIVSCAPGSIQKTVLCTHNSL